LSKSPVILTKVLSHNGFRDDFEQVLKSLKLSPCYHGLGSGVSCVGSHYPLITSLQCNLIPISPSISCKMGIKTDRKYSKRPLYSDIKLYNMQGLTDEQLLLLDVRCGNKDAFDVLLTRYIEFTNKVAFRLLRNEESAGNISQLAFHDLWEDRGKIGKDFLLKTYLSQKIFKYCKDLRNHRLILPVNSIQKY